MLFSQIAWDRDVAERLIFSGLCESMQILLGVITMPPIPISIPAKHLNPCDCE